MKRDVEFRVDTAPVDEIARHLVLEDANFQPRLSERVDIPGYARRIAEHATRFEAWSEGALVGLVACYCNDPRREVAFITSVSVSAAWTGRGVGGRLLDRCIEHAESLGFACVELDVGTDNVSALRLYQRKGFARGPVTPPSVRMHRMLRVAGEK